MSASASKIPIRSALKNLHRYGAEALQPRKRTDSKKWYKPKVSRRIANDLRKQAIREDTFGAYDPLLGKGWDPLWDQLSDNTDHQRMRGSKISWMQLRPPKETKRERTREARALKIENMLEEADKKIAEYKLAQKEKKPEPGIENVIKRMTKQGKK